MASGRDRSSGSVNEHLWAVAERFPDAIALSDGPTGGWSFAELVDRTRSCSAWLSREHPGNHDPIVVLMDHRPLAVALQLSIMGTGRPALVLDPQHPVERLESVLAEAAPVATICAESDTDLARGLANTGAVHPVQSLPEGSSRPPRAPDELDGAVLLFTSGSTGRPKGIVANHRGLVTGAAALGDAGVAVPGDRMALATPLGLAGAVVQCAGALLNGAQACLFPLQRLGMPGFVQWMAASGITMFPAVPTLARAAAASLGPTKLADLRQVWIGGEQMTRDDVQMLRSMSARPVRIAHCYASTEMTLITLEVIEPEHHPADLFPLSMGAPVPGVSLQVRSLEAPDAPVEQGIGELVVSAPIISRGYWREPDLTSRQFRFDVDDDRLEFRTGDLARVVPGGLTLVGRSDSMVKIRGQRVELGAVEAALRAVPHVGDAAAVVLDDAEPGPVLVAHVEPEGGRQVIESEVIGQLRRNLPSVMVPRRVVVLGQLPKLPNGKIDRSALRLPSDEVVQPVVGPRTDTERRVLKMIEAVVGVEELSVLDDFFAVGGDSLQAIELLVRLEQEFGVPMRMSSWLTVTTAAELASLIERGPAESRSVVSLQVGEPDRPPLVVANDLHGTAFRLRDLAAALGAEQTSWGLESPLLDGGSETPRSIAEIAAIHLRELPTVRGEPLNLIGYSWGAVLVFEMARQLESAGRPIGFIGLIDFGPVHLRHAPRAVDAPRPPGGWPERAPSNLPLTDKVRHHIDRLAGEPRGQRLRYASRVAGAARQFDLQSARRDLRRHGRIRPELRPAYAWYTAMDLALEYRFGRLTADVVVFVSDQTLKGRMNVSRRVDFLSLTEPTLGWREYVDGKIDVVPVVGHHNDLVEEPYVAGLGAAVRRAFDEWLADRR